MLTEDKTIHALYGDFIAKSLDYVVTSLKFLSYTITPGTVIKPDYLPYEKVAGFNKNYNESLGQCARVQKMDTNNQHPFVLGRVKNNLSLHAMDAYREIFDGNGEYVKKVMPARLPLLGHFKPADDPYYNPLYDKTNARGFIDRAGSKDMPSIKTKRDRMIFYAETFGNQVHNRYRHKIDLFDFNRALEENCKAITQYTEFYFVMMDSLVPYVT